MAHSLQVALGSLAFTLWPWQVPVTILQSASKLGCHGFADSFPFFWLADHALVACVDSQFLRDGYSHQGKGHPHWHQLKHLLVLSAEWLKIDQGLTLHLLEVVFLIRFYLLSF